MLHVYHFYTHYVAVILSCMFLLKISLSGDVIHGILYVIIFYSLILHGLLILEPMYAVCMNRHRVAFLCLHFGSLIFF